MNYKLCNKCRESYYHTHFNSDKEKWLGDNIVKWDFYKWYCPVTKTNISHESNPPENCCYVLEEFMFRELPWYVKFWDRFTDWRKDYIG